MITIEVIGPAGAGKTTLINAVCSNTILRHKVKILSCSSPLKFNYFYKKIYLKFDFFCKIYKIFHPFLHKGLADWKNSIRKVIRTSSDFRYTAEKCNESLIIFDEIGVFHSIQWFGIRARINRPNFEKLTNSRWFRDGLPSMLIFLEISDKTRRERRQRRGRVSDKRYFLDLELQQKIDINRQMILCHLKKVAIELDQQKVMRFIMVNVDDEKDGGLEKITNVLIEGIGTQKPVLSD